MRLGFAWADAMVRYDYATMADYGRVYPGPIEPDEAAQKRIDEITAELEKLQLEMEDEGLEDGAYNALYERVDALEEEARDLQEAYSAEDLARSGGNRVLVGRAGDPPCWPRPPGRHRQKGGRARLLG
mgnify:CR=1 FL=1